MYCTTPEIRLVGGKWAGIMVAWLSRRITEDLSNYKASFDRTKRPQWIPYYPPAGMWPPAPNVLCPAIVTGAHSAGTPWTSIYPQLRALAWPWKTPRNNKTPGRAATFKDRAAVERVHVLTGPATGVTDRLTSQSFAALTYSAIV